MSRQAKWWGDIRRKHEELKKANPYVDTCRLCWVRSGLPAVTFHGEETLCPRCGDLLQRIMLLEEDESTQALHSLAHMMMNARGKGGDG